MRQYDYLFYDEAKSYLSEYPYFLYKKYRSIKNAEEVWFIENIHHKYKAFRWLGLAEEEEDGNIYVFFFKNGEDYLKFILTFGGDEWN